MHSKRLRDRLTTMFTVFLLIEYATLSFEVNRADFMVHIFIVYIFDTPKRNHSVKSIQFKKKKDTENAYLM
jgi:hypothetical protein